MDDQDREYFWRGPVRTRAHALKLISGAGWTFVVMGGLFSLPSLLNAPTTRDLSGMITILLVMVVPGAFLLNRRSRAAAIAMLVVPALFSIVFLVLPFILVFSGAGLAMSLAPLVGAGMWGLLALLAWRAFQAARALRRLNADDYVAADVAESFT
ncbi:hypothetical protein [Caulobacter sp. 17J65-9]|uniref:hypothetical protein n=1 Tax=Caulobacter sp. 17J65-9 TaxID=2709382 RepID=UPI0013C5BF7A|nr:hypothetical protein [Caulobacter sp. 17J65-9]NEX92725.1 hypothetical protein [Caulobacter sp. 17J65-9]